MTSPQIVPSSAYYIISYSRNDPPPGGDAWLLDGPLPIVQGEYSEDLDGNITLITTRLLLQFDTSFIGTDTVSKVELYQKLLATPSAATNFEVDYYLGGTFAVDQTSYEGGTLAFSQSGLAAAITDGAYIDLGATACTLINKTGNTTLKIANPKNDAPIADPDGFGTILFDVTGGLGSVDPCKLRITYGPSVNTGNMAWGVTSGGGSSGKILANT